MRSPPKPACTTDCRFLRLTPSPVCSWSDPETHSSLLRASYALDDSLKDLAVAKTFAEQRVLHVVQCTDKQQTATKKLSPVLFFETVVFPDVRVRGVTPSTSR